MYSDTEIETAIASGAIDRAAADRLRASVAAQRQSLPADDEMFRLVTGFNDIFVTIAAALVIFAAWNIIGGLAAAAVSWGLSEYFTRQKRMALPSIFLLLCFACGVFSTLNHVAYGLTMPDPTPWSRYPYRSHSGISSAFLMAMAASAMLTAAAISAHWRRFHVPITIAALTSALALVVGCLLTLSLIWLGLDAEQAVSVIPWLAFLIGLAIFAYAMKWDLADPERVTRKSDVAFWLHLTASPLIVHPLFWQLAKISAAGGSDGDIARGIAAVLAILLYALLGLVALVVDRRAVLVSALAYVVVAMTYLLRSDGQVGSTIAVAGALIGGLLLAMSVYWRDLRRATLSLLPENYRSMLPRAPV